MRKLQNTDIFRTIVMHWNAQRNADESNRSANQILFLKRPLKD